jgi:selenium metabolism protein YedF
MTVIDCSGMLCPRPLIEAKKAYTQASVGDSILFIVDNETASNNLNTFFSGNGVASTTTTEGNKYKITVLKSELTQNTIAVSNPAEFCIPTVKDEQSTTVVVISSNKMGEGDSDLGAILIKGFFTALSEAAPLPSEVIFYNSGVLLLPQESGIMASLEKLRSNGVKITACGTCVDFYGIKEKLTIGTISNMFNILSSLNAASKIINP